MIIVCIINFIIFYFNHFNMNAEAHELNDLDRYNLIQTD